MTYYEAINTMRSAATKQNKYNFAACEGVINAIMNHYMITTNYYFNDCINTFKSFLNSGVLSFS